MPETDLLGEEVGCERLLLEAARRGDAEVERVAEHDHAIDFGGYLNIVGTGFRDVPPVEPGEEGRRLVRSRPGVEHLCLGSRHIAGVGDPLAGQLTSGLMITTRLCGVSVVVRMSFGSRPVFVSSSPPR